MGAAKWIIGLLGLIAGGPAGGLIGFVFGALIDQRAKLRRMLNGGSGRSGRPGSYSGSGSANGYGSGGSGRSGGTGNYGGSGSANGYGSGGSGRSGDFGGFDGSDFGGWDFESFWEWWTGMQGGNYTGGYGNSGNGYGGSGYGGYGGYAGGGSGYGGYSGGGQAGGRYTGQAGLQDAYSVLGIDQSASDDEVKSAYRRMAMKSHPDMVATESAEVQAAAAEKFRQVQEAYEAIKKQRGID